MAFFLSRQPGEEPRLGIYVHIPFCKSKCEYCDFYSIGGARDRRMTDDYLQALADHIRESGRLAPNHLVDTVYFGGGTPSFFGAENLEKILDEIHRSFRLSVEAEITVEANPDSVNVQGLKRMLRAGFNRLSLGVQSDDDAMLKRLGRPHNFEQARTAMQKARQVGFANISLDLMYGLPNQTRAGWQETVEHIARMRPEHVSCYALKVEEGTPLYEYKDAVNLPSDDVQADMYLDACEILRSYGFEHYEISNFAKRGFASKHNMKYWTGGEYLGFGPTAASDFDGKRFTIIRDLRGYINGISSVVSYNLGRGDRERLSKLFRISIGALGAVALFVTALSYLLGGRVVDFFAKGNEHVAAVALHGFRIVATSFVMLAYNTFSSGWFTALNDGRTSAILSFCRTMIFLVLPVLVLPRLFGIDGVWLSLTAGEIFSLIMGIYYFRKFRSVWTPER